MSPSFPLAMVYTLISLLILCASVSASVLSIRQGTNVCPETCYGGPIVDSNDTTYYRSLCMDQNRLSSIVICFRDTCPGTDAEIADLKDRCADADVTLTVTYTANSIEIKSSFGTTPAPVPSTTTSPLTTDTRTLVTPTIPSTSSSSSSSKTSSHPSSSSATHTPPPDFDSNTDPTGSSPMGAIIGGAVGGGVPVILLFILGFVLWWRNRNSEDNDGTEKGMLPTPTPTPSPPPSSPAVQPAHLQGRASPGTDTVASSNTQEAYPDPQRPTQSQRLPVYEPTT